MLTAAAPVLHAQSGSDVSPRYWAVAGEGLAAALGQGEYASNFSHEPMLGVGFRYARREGVELTALVTQALNRNDDGFIKTPRSPDLTGATLSWMTIRGSPNQPFSQLLAFGVGAYREHGTQRSDIGVSGHIDTAMRVFGFGTVSTQFGLTVLPNAPGGHLYLLSLLFPFRTR
jgi:hypothetical protein